MVSCFAKRFSSRHATAFDTAFRKAAEGDFHKGRKIFELFCSQRRKPHFTQINKARNTFKLPFQQLTAAVVENCFLNLIRSFPSCLQIPSKQLSLMHCFGIRYFFVCVRSSKSFCGKKRVNIRVMETRRATAVHFIICCSEDLVAILQTKVYVL